VSARDRSSPHAWQMRLQRLVGGSVPDSEEISFGQRGLGHFTGLLERPLIESELPWEHNDGDRTKHKRGWRRIRGWRTRQSHERRYLQKTTALHGVSLRSQAAKSWWIGHANAPPNPRKPSLRQTARLRGLLPPSSSCAFRDDANRLRRREAKWPLGGKIVASHKPISL
jgi:hypothetical protein